MACEGLLSWADSDILRRHRIGELLREERDLYTVDKDKTVGDALKIMRAHSISSIPVVDPKVKRKKDRHFLGFLSLRLVLPALVNLEKDTIEGYERPVTDPELMSKDVFIFSSTEPMNRLQEAFNRGVDRVLVRYPDHAVHLFSQVDVVAFLQHYAQTHMDQFSLLVNQNVGFLGLVKQTVSRPLLVSPPATQVRPVARKPSDVHKGKEGEGGQPQAPPPLQQQQQSGRTSMGELKAGDTLRIETGNDSDDETSPQQADLSSVQQMGRSFVLAQAMVSLPSDATVIEGFRLMKERDLEGLAVVNEEGRLVCTLSEADLRDLGENCREVFRTIAEFRAGKPPIVCRATDSLAQVLDLLVSNRVHCVWVVSQNHGRPIDTISLPDIIATFTPTSATSQRK